MVTGTSVCAWRSSVHTSASFMSTDGNVAILRHGDVSLLSREAANAGLKLCSNQSVAAQSSLQVEHRLLADLDETLLRPIKIDDQDDHCGERQ